MCRYLYILISFVRVLPVGLFCIDMGPTAIDVGGGWLWVLSGVRTCRLVHSHGQLIVGCLGWGLAQGFVLVGGIVRMCVRCNVPMYMGDRDGGC